MSGARILVWWPEARPVGSPDPFSLGEEVEVFRAVDAADEVAYFPLSGGPADTSALEATLRAAYPSARITRQSLLLDCAGAAAGAAAPFHYIVATDVMPSAESDFNAWYQDEHLPGLAGVPGTVRARRHRNADDAPRYHACYDLMTAETLGSPEWLAVRATAWSSRVRPSFCNTTRVMMRRVAA